jgi:hypothetical protein
MPRFASPALSLGLPIALGWMVLGLSPGGVRAELPPWVYGEQQRRAPVVVRLRVLQSVREGSEADVRGEVLRVWRQPGNAVLKPGQAIGLRYPLPPERKPGLVGPSALRLPRQGEELNAWLQPIQGQRDTFSPAAGGQSFGPSLEAFRQP